MRGTFSTSAKLFPTRSLFVFHQTKGKPQLFLSRTSFKAFVCFSPPAVFWSHVEASKQSSSTRCSSLRAPELRHSWKSPQLRTAQPGGQRPGHWVIRQGCYSWLSSWPAMQTRAQHFTFRWLGFHSHNNKYYMCSGQGRRWEDFGKTSPVIILKNQD